MQSQPLIIAKAGFYGKMPAHGDFVRYQLNRHFIEPWDDWLQQVMHHLQHSMGAEWINLYTTSPIYRFYLTAGICGDNAWRGAIMPSVDKVGRYYPLTIAAPVSAQDNPFDYLDQQKEWYERVEQLLLACLKQELPANILQQEIQRLDSHQIHQEDDLPPLKQLAIRFPIDESIPLSTIYSDLLHQSLLQTHFAYSLWQCAGSQQVAPSFLLCQGLPPVEQSIALFNGEWSERGWLDYQPDFSDTELQPE